MIKIWKYEVKVDDIVTIRMPVNSRIIKIGVQNPRCICFWAIIFAQSSVVEKKFRIYGTDHPIESVPGDYIDTVFDGPFVWHVFREL